MAKCGVPSPSSSVFQGWLEVWKDWQITILVMTTMTLQTWLVAAGCLRKHTSSVLVHCSVWLAFIGVDAVSAYAIGVMLGSAGTCDNVLAVWAPMVLLHLGAADCASAFSPADNDLWKRHLIKMTLEVCAGGYIISRSPPCNGAFLASGIMTFIVGTFWYCERVYALWSGSTAQVVKSSRPIYKFMALDHHAAYPDQQNPLIVSGESSAKLHGSSVVTFDDIVKCRELKNYIHEVCLAYALFKIYRRRLANLRIHHKDDDYDKVRKVFFPSSVAEPAPLKIIRVIDLELSFIFDGVFTKGAAGSAYQGFGVATRVVSCLLLFITVMVLLAAGAGGIVCKTSTGGSNSRVHMVGGLTILLVSIGLLVDVVQVYMLMKSNWMRVWLACTYITERRAIAASMDHHYLNSFHRYNVRAILRALRYVGKPKSRHWDQKLGQKSIVVDGISSAVWRYVQHLEIEEALAVWEERAIILNMVDVDAENVHYFLIQKLAGKFADVTSNNLAHRREQIARSMSFPFGYGEGPEFSPESDSGLEEAVLLWHIATSVCEMDLMKVSSQHESPRQMDSVKSSIALSRYCMYLLISCTKLTPADPDHFRPIYAQSRNEMTKLVLQHPHALESALLRDHRLPDTTAESRSSTARIDAGIRLGRALMEIGSWEERWSKLSQVWVDILVYVAISENAHPHVEQLARGGELLTHLWVLLGHLGFGQKSWITRPDGRA